MQEGGEAVFVVGEHLKGSPADLMEGFLVTSVETSVPQPYDMWISTYVD